MSLINLLANFGVYGIYSMFDRAFGKIYIDEQKYLRCFSKRKEVVGLHSIYEHINLQ
jgi:hypothetical protein